MCRSLVGMVSEDLNRAYDALLARMREDRAAGAVVEDSERDRRLGVVTAYSWLANGDQVGPMSDGPATPARLRSELELANRAARAAYPGRYDSTAWRALGVAQVLAIHLGDQVDLVTGATVGQRAA